MNKLATVLCEKKGDYLGFKILANKYIQEILSINSDDAAQILKSLKTIAIDGEIQVGLAAGLAEHSENYYKAEIILSIKNFEKGNMNEIVFLRMNNDPMVRGQSTENLVDFNEVTHMNLLKVLILVEYLRNFTSRMLAFRELMRLTGRDGAKCEYLNTSGGVTFI